MTRKEQQCEYYARNRERVLARQKKYKEANRELIRARDRAWAKKNPERVNAWHRRYYQQNRERLRAKGLARTRTVESREYHRQYYQKNKEAVNRKVRRTTLLRKYGITPEDRDALLAKQAALCAICSGGIAGKRKSHVDHDHATGRIRGLLCNNCNRGLGHFHDDPRKLEAAIAYLAA